VKTILPIAALLSAALFSASCGGDKKNEENVKQDSTQTAVVFDPAVEKILPLFKEAEGFPYKVDTSLLNHVEGDSLVGEQVKTLAVNWPDYVLLGGTEGELKDFYTIDSKKAKGAYSKWAEGLDIGMTKFANAYALHKIKLDEKTWVLTWALSASSYEACPYFSGTHVYATLVYEGKPTQTYILGEVESAGDPPVSMNRNLTSEFTADGKIALHEFEESDDMDAEFSTQVKNKYWFEIKDGKFVQVKEEKGKEVNVPHPAEVTTEE